MQRKNREVNIINLSMLDVITGALGAVLILVIILSGRPDSNQLEEMRDELEKTRQKLTQDGASRELVEQLQRELQRALNQMEQYQDALNKADKRNRQLQVRRPLTAQIWWQPHDQDVDIYVRMADKDPPVDPNQKQHARYNGDMHLDIGPGVSESWLIRDLPPATYELWVKLMKGSAQLRTTQVQMRLLYGGESSRIFSVGAGSLTAQSRSLLMGIVQMDAQGKLTLQRGKQVTPIDGAAQ